MKHLALLAALVLGCSKQPPSPPETPALRVYNALVDGGCLADTEVGLADVEEEGESDAAPTWFSCLWNGGTVLSCSAPCSPATKLHFRRRDGGAP